MNMIAEARLQSIRDIYSEREDLEGKYENEKRYKHQIMTITIVNTRSSTYFME